MAVEAVIPRSFLHVHRFGQADFNQQLSGIRAATERAVASVKTWRMLSEEGGRYRAPISKYGEMLAAVTGLFFASNYYNPS